MAYAEKIADDTVPVQDNVPTMAADDRWRDFSGQAFSDAMEYASREAMHKAQAAAVADAGPMLADQPAVVDGVDLDINFGLDDEDWAAFLLSTKAALRD